MKWILLFALVVSNIAWNQAYNRITGENSELRAANSHEETLVKSYSDSYWELERSIHKGETTFVASDGTEETRSADGKLISKTYK